VQRTNHVKPRLLRNVIIVIMLTAIKNTVIALINQSRDTQFNFPDPIGRVTSPLRLLVHCRGTDFETVRRTLVMPFGSPVPAVLRVLSGTRRSVRSCAFIVHTYSSHLIRLVSEGGLCMGTGGDWRCCNISERTQQSRIHNRSKANILQRRSYHGRWT
jgi:hypothetical protein